MLLCMLSLLDNFSASEVLGKVPLEEYITYTIYCLEYRSLIVELMSEHKEQAFLASLTDDERVKHTQGDDLVEAVEEPELPPYGLVQGICVIRDLVS